MDSINFTPALPQAVPSPVRLPSGDQTHPVLPCIPYTDSGGVDVPLSKRAFSLPKSPDFAESKDYKSKAEANMAAFLKKNMSEVPAFSRRLPFFDENLSRFLRLEGGEGLLELCKEMYAVLLAERGREAAEAFFGGFNKRLAGRAKTRELLSLFYGSSEAHNFHSGVLSRFYYSQHWWPVEARVKGLRLILKALSENQDLDNISAYMLKQDLLLAKGDALLRLKPEAFGSWLRVHHSLYRLVHEQLAGSKISEKSAEAISHFLWSCFPGGRLSAETFRSIEGELKQYAESQIAKPALSTMFQNPLAMQSAQDVELNKGALLSGLDIRELTYGEEFEFYIKEPGSRPTDEEFMEVLKKWAGYIEEALQENHILDYDIKLSEGSFDSYLSLWVGGWHARIFIDGDVLEVNTSPYRLDGSLPSQRESAGRGVDTYQLFDLVVFGITEKMGLKPRSGHKHVDISRALHGNSEVLFRLLVDVDCRAWLPRLQRREARSESMFSYLKQGKAAESRAMEFLIGQFNQQLEVAPQRRKGACYADVVQLERALTDLGISHRLRPLNLKHLSLTEVTTPAAKVTRPKTTIEFRFPQSARNGDEAKIMNEMLCAWLQLMERNQRANKPLKAEFNDPMEYKDDQEVMRLFRGFIQELGLDWGRFLKLSHIDSDLKTAPVPPPGINGLN